MVLTRSRSSQVECLIAVPGLVVVPLTLLSVHMPDVVSIILLKFVCVDVTLSSEFTLPHFHAFLHGESESLEEET